MSKAIATRRQRGLLLDLVNLRRELRCRIELRELAGKTVGHLLPHLRRVEAAIRQGEFVDIN